MSDNNTSKSEEKKVSENDNNFCQIEGLILITDETKQKCEPEHLQNILPTDLGFPETIEGTDDDATKNIGSGTCYLNNTQNTHFSSKLNNPNHCLSEPEEISHNEASVSSIESFNDMETDETDKEVQMMRNTFVMCTKVLKIQLQVAKHSIALETSDADSLNEINHFIEVAEKEFLTDNLIEARNNLFKAEELFDSIAVKVFPVKLKINELCDEYLRMKKSKTNSNRSGVSVRGSPEDADVFLNMARTAMFTEQNFDKAERLLKKSVRIRPSAEATNLLSQLPLLRNAVPNTESLSTDKFNVDTINSAEENNTALEVERQIQFDKDEAETYLAVAQNAFKDNDLKRALIFLLKSEKLYTLDGARELRIQLTSLRTEESDKSDSKDRTLKYIETAKKALLDLDYEKAFVFARAAHNLSQNETTNKLLKVVNEDILNKKRKDEAELCLKYAEIEFDEVNLLNAELMCSRAQELFPTEQGEELLRKLHSKSNWCEIL